MKAPAINQLLEQQFPSLQKMIYLNHAAISPWPLVTSEAVSRFATENNQSGPLRTSAWLNTENQLRERVAGLLNATSGQDIAFLKNTSEGICTVANGIDWRMGDNVVTCREEFISNQMAWDALEAQGVEIRKISVLQQENPESALLSAMDKRTRVLTVSAVQWESGFRLDLEALGKGCEGSGVIFFVDAIQQFPVIPIDVQRCRIDALAASAHKWQMGPEGIALFYCRESLRDSLVLKQQGWRMLDEPYRFTRPDRLPSPTARRFEIGSPNTMGQAALNASLGLFDEIGITKVERRVMENTARITAFLGQFSQIEVRSPVESSRQSGIISFIPGNTEPSAFRRELSKQKVFVADRGALVRLSPHFYQAGRSIDQLLNMMEDQIKLI